jgi:uncharacterized protein (DUF488 family)
VLQPNQIQYLLDVRSSPYSSYKPEFSKNALQNFLEANGIRYLFMGDSLGGLPDDEACYTDGKVDYEKLSERSYFLAGIERLHKASKQSQRVVLMCSEGRPENCHRSKLIGQVLTAQGIEVLHIDEQDKIISQKDVLLRLTGGQASLFGDDFFTFTSQKRYRREEQNDDADLRE